MRGGVPGANRSPGFGGRCAEALPLYDAVSQLVYAGARHWVRDVWIAGRAKLRDHRLVDIDTDRLAANARRWQHIIRQVPRA